MAKEQPDRIFGQTDVHGHPRAAGGPSVRPASGPLLFVVQQHSARRLHYDFRLECDGVLKSWAVPRGPALDPNEKRLAVQTEDHPFDYASFEGVIPPGQYGAGEVIVWDCGVYSPDEGGATWFHDRDAAEREVREGLAKGKLSFLLRGEKLKGSFALVSTKEAKQWLLLKHKDRFAAPVDVTTQNRSVLSGDGGRGPQGRARAADSRRGARAFGQGRRRCLSKLAPMLAETGDAPFNRPDWMWEPKLDGYRVLAFIDEHGVKLRSRRGLELAPKFPQLAAELGKQAVNGMILDGEIVAFNGAGKPSFGALQDRAQLKTEREIAAADQSTPVVFYCFDMPHFAGIDLARFAVSGSPPLSRAVPAADSPRVQLVHAADDGAALQAAALASGFEGVVAQAQGKRLRGRPAFDVVGEGEADAGRGLRRRRLHARQGLARAARRDPRRLLGGRKDREASSATRRTSARASTSARSRR